MSSVASPDPFLRYSQRPLSAWLAAVVLVANLLVGGLAPTGWGDGMVVCTADGLQLLGPDGQPRPAPGGDHDICLLCLPLGQGGLDLPPLGPALDLPTAARTASWPAHQHSGPLRPPSNSPGLARAPPSV